MGVRATAILAILLSSVGIILFSAFAGIGFARTNIEKSIETDMSVVANIAERFISSEIESLKLKGVDVVHRLTETGETEWPEILASSKTVYPEFIGASVFDGGKGLLVSSGESAAPRELLSETFMRLAFGGEKVISSTYKSGNGVVFYLALPVPGLSGKVLALTIPGMYFSERLSSFVVWKTGHIFIDDSDGNVIANIREEWVQNRINFLRMAETGEQYSGIAAVIKRMLNGETGIGRFSIDGVPRICAYRPLAGSPEGWYIGVIAPLPESPARNLDGGILVVGLVGFFMSVIAAFIASGFIKKPFERIAVLKEASEASSRAKSKFLTTMSHEMRTPLNAVIGLSELTLDGKISGEERDNIEKVYTSGVTLLGIINDILDISNIESGRFELNPVDYDVSSLINDAVTLNIINLGEKPVAFKLFVDETLPSKLRGDDLRIKQIFNNILSNAFNYTEAGTVEWHLSWEKEGGDIWLTGSVKDTGIGIREEDIPKLFINYNQADREFSGKTGGPGLGLAIAEHMVEFMDGSIGVESEYGKGSTFSFRIKQGFVTDTPIGPAVKASLENFQYINQKKNRNTKMVRVHLPYARVLVVDDVPSNLTVVRGVMKPYGMKVVCAGSGEEAVRLVREGEKFNAIFMDHMMPGMDGIEAVRIIRNEIGTEYAKTVPIIALTANAVRGSEEMFLNSGFQAFLSKPIDLVKMDSVIRKWVRNRELDREFSEPAESSGGTAEAASTAEDNTNADSVNTNASVNSSAKSIEGVDLEKTLEQFGGDEDSLKEVLRAYADQMPAMLERLRDFSADKLRDYIVVAHGIKGSSRSIYAERVGSLAESLEHAGKTGNIDFIEKNNSLLIKEIEKLMSSINVWLE